MVRLLYAHNTSAPAGRPAILADNGMPVTVGPTEEPAASEWTWDSTAFTFDSTTYTFDGSAP